MRIRQIQHWLPIVKSSHFPRNPFECFHLGWFLESTFPAILCTSLETEDLIHVTPDVEMVVHAAAYIYASYIIHVLNVWHKMAWRTPYRYARKWPSGEYEMYHRKSIIDGWCRMRDNNKIETKNNETMMLMTTMTMVTKWLSATNYDRGVNVGDEWWKRMKWKYLLLDARKA